MIREESYSRTTIRPSSFASSRNVVSYLVYIESALDNKWEESKLAIKNKQQLYSFKDVKAWVGSIDNRVYVITPA